MSGSVPRLRGVAFAEDVVLVNAHCAWFLATALENTPGGPEGCLDRMGIRGGDARNALLGAYEALAEAGARWQASLSASPRGNGERHLPDQPLPSETWISTKQAAYLLVVTPRRVRQLAEAGTLNSRLWQGRRELVRDEVLALRELRNQRRAA
jgi:hypothetical protein